MLTHTLWICWWLARAFAHLSHTLGLQRRIKLVSVVADYTLHTTETPARHKTWTGMYIAPILSFFSRQRLLVAHTGPSNMHNVGVGDRQLRIFDENGSVSCGAPSRLSETALFTHCGVPSCRTWLRSDLHRAECIYSQGFFQAA